MDHPYIKIIKTNNSSDNPLKNDEIFKLAGLYCEKVIEDKKMLVIENALDTDNWKNAPEIKSGLVSYLGFPIETPAGEIYGTICVLNKQEKQYLKKDRALLLEFKQVIETQLENIDLNDKLSSRIKESEKLKEKYHSLFNSINDPLFLHQYDSDNKNDKSGEIIEVNKRAVNVLGYEREKLLGRSLADISAIKLDRKTPKRKMFNELDKYGEITFEDLFLTKEGEKIIFEFNSKIINHNQKKVILSAARDISKRKQTEKELKAKKELFEGIIESISDIILIQKLDHTIEQYNKAGYEFLNRDMDFEKIKGEKCFELMGKSKECEICPVRKVIKTKELETAEKYFPELDTYFDIRSKPILNKNGEIIFIVEHLRDITARKKQEEELRNHKNLLQSLTNKVPGVVYQFQMSADNSFSFPYVTDDVYKIFEVTPKEVKNKANKVFEKLHPDDYDKIITSIRESAEKLTIWEEEFRIKLSEKGLRWLEGYAEPEKRADGSVLWHGNIRDITEKKKREERLEYQLHFQELAADISSQLVDINSSKFKQTINEALEKISIFFAFDQSLIFKFIDKKKYILKTHQWSAEKVNAKTEELDKLTAAEFSWLLEKLYSREEVIIEDIEKLEKRAEKIKEMLKKQDVKSVVFIPSFIEGDLFGFYAFELVKKEIRFENELINKLKIITDIITRSFSEYLKDEKIEILYQKLDSEINKTAVVHEKNFLVNQPQYEEISFASYFKPTQRIGGDFYNFIKVNNKLIFYLSDITGHGLEGVVFNSFIKESISSYSELKDSLEVEKIMGHVYKQYLKNNFPDDYFICLFMLVLDLESMEMEYVSSGFQHFPLAAKKDRKLVLKNSGFPITSAIPEDMMDFKKSFFNLEKETTIIFYTDGIIEQMQNGRMYGDRLKKVFYENSNLKPEAIKKKILNDFKVFNNNSLKTDDDITFIIIQS